MTIPSRPAPAPPVTHGQTAAAGANACIEQLRLQLEDQQKPQQKSSGKQNLTIKLAPPSKAPINNNNQNKNNSENSSITRKFPQARYAPVTNWGDISCNQITDGSATTKYINNKKVPPPRPPPPRLSLNDPKLTAPAPTVQSMNILTIFNRKKNKALKTTGNSARTYSASAGVYGSINNTTSTSHGAINSKNTINWNTSWQATSQYSLATHSMSGLSQETQLINFESPPSSPTLTQKSNSDCLSVDSFSSDSNFSSPNNGSVSQPESGFEDDFSGSRPPTISPLDPWETVDTIGNDVNSLACNNATIGTAPVRNFNTASIRIQTGNDNPLCNGKSLLPPAPSLIVPTIIKPKVSQKPKAPKPPVLEKSLPHASMSANITDWSTEPDTLPSPPMPQCPPPALPMEITLLDVISGKVDAIYLVNDEMAGHAEETPGKQPYGVTLYEFDGVEEGDLSFRENEKIYLLQHINAEWYRGRSRAGCEGIFPANYIDVKVPLTESIDRKCTKSIYQCENSFIGNAPRVRCLYNFSSEIDGDLALKENDMVTVLYKINEDWLYGEINGRQGQLPSNFLEYVPVNIPQANLCPAT